MMEKPRFIAVIDIGKTNAKVALVDARASTEIAMRKAPNTVLPGPLYPHYDVERLWRFILDGLTALQAAQAIDAVSVTTHGACAALVDADGRLVLPILDYEHDGPDSLRADYDDVRPPFRETGSPPLPAGLNLGAQLHWQEVTFPQGFAAAEILLPYPQYWSMRLTGVAACEVTSLGCHTDLWDPGQGCFSSLVDRMGWRRLMPSSRRAGDRLGPVLPAIAAATGLAAGTPVFTGIHDSNASLVPHLLSRRPPFAVVSTGTWVVAMAVGSAIPVLDPSRDTLVNVNAFGQPVPSARFMGGRDHEILAADATLTAASAADVEAVLAETILLLPSVQLGSGPFPGRHAHWRGSRMPQPGEKGAAIAFHLALMTATCLRLIAAEGLIIVEGPFAANALYCRMLAAATGRTVVTDEDGLTGTSVGAALLAADGGHRDAAGGGLATTPASPAWVRYVRAWEQAAG